MKIACIMMQKNEDLLLEGWIIHHACLFGLENLFIYDNGSTSLETVDVLKKYQKTGVNVIWNRVTQKDFNRKGWIIGDLIKSLQASSQYDFYIPLDCDEFVALADGNGLSISRNDIFAYFADEIGHDRVLKVTRCLLNAPGSLDVFAIIRHKKTIMPARGFKSLDHGFHEGELVSSKDFKNSNIVYVHLHNKPFDKILQSAKDKLAPFVDVENLDALKNYDGVGKHLVRYFFDFESTYASSVDKFPRISFENIAYLFDAFHLDDAKRAWQGNLPAAESNINISKFLAAQEYISLNKDVERTDAPLLFDCYLHYWESQKRSPAFLQRLGYKAMSERNWGEAETYWKAFSESSPNDPTGYAMQVCALRELKKLDEAEELGRQSIQKFPDHYMLFLHWALIVFPKRDWIEGRRRFAEMRRKFPDQKEGYVRGIAIERELKDSDAAQALFACAVKKFPGDPI